MHDFFINRLPSRIKARLWSEIAIASRLIDSKRAWFAGAGVTVVSPGGVATTAVIDHLSRFVHVNDRADRDNKKHRPKPPSDASSRLIFVYGEAEDSLRSIDRRGWLRIQSAKLGSAGGAYLPKRFATLAFKRAVVKQHEAFHSFSAARGNCIALHYDDIWDSADVLAKFLHINNPGFVSEFPDRKERKIKSKVRKNNNP